MASGGFRAVLYAQSNVTLAECERNHAEVLMSLISKTFFSAILVCSLEPSLAQEPGGTTVTETRETIIEQKSSAPGATNGGANVTKADSGEVRHVVKFKYKERLNTYAEQIQMALSKGALTKEDTDRLTERLNQLRQLEQSVSAKNYPREDLDNMDKQFTSFNQDFTATANKAAAPAASSATAKPAADSTLPAGSGAPGKKTPK